MKKIFAVMLIACVLVHLFGACSGKLDGSVATTAEPTVATTAEPAATTAESAATTAEPAATTAEPVATTAEPAATTAELDSDTEVFLAEQGKTDYMIVCPKKSQAFVKDAGKTLCDAISKKYNVDFVLRDDTAEESGDGVCEILIGATNRKESREVLETLEPGEYKVCLMGNKLVMIGSNDYLTSIAVESFIHSVVDPADNTHLAISADYFLHQTQADFYSVLDGITLYAMGDSYFGGSIIGKRNTWVNLLGEKYAMHYVNYGIGGSTMANYIASNYPMVERFTTMEKGDADVILLEGGRNDRTFATPLGRIDSREPQTFRGAINIMLDSMLDTYPNALIILITPWNSAGRVAETGLGNVDYANAMRSIVKYRNDDRIVCLYAADPKVTGVNMIDKNFRAQYCIGPSDESHLNEEGMRLVLPYMERFIAAELAKFKGVSLDG